MTTEMVTVPRAEWEALLAFERYYREDYGHAQLQAALDAIDEARGACWGDDDDELRAARQILRDETPDEIAIGAAVRILVARGLLDVD